MPAEYEEMKASLRKAHPEWAPEKVAEMAARTFASVFGTNPQHAEKLEKEGKWGDYKSKHKKSSSESKESIGELFVSPFEFKEEDGNQYVEGFVSDPTMDIGHDILEDQQKLVDKLNSDDGLAKKLSWRHDWMKAGEGAPPPLPFGTRVGPAELRQNPISKEMAAWVKYKLNPQHENFDAKTQQIKDGHVDGFSIEYEVLPNGATYEQVGNMRVRHINDYRLVGVGVAARPVHPNAVMTSFYAKEFDYVESKDHDMEKREMAQNFMDAHKEEFVKLRADNPSLSEKTLWTMIMEKHGQGSVAARQSKEADAGTTNGGNDMAGEDAELRKQLEAKEARIKELEAKDAANSKMSAEFKEQLDNVLKEVKESRVLMNGQSGEAQGKEATKQNGLESKELEAKEARAKKWAEYKEKPTWDGASELIRMNGGIIQIG